MSSKFISKDQSTMVSLLTSAAPIQRYTIYYEYEPSKFCEIKLPNDSIVEQAIDETVRQLNQNYGFNLTENVKSYQLYAAKKSGKKNTDLPSLQFQQQLSKTKIKRFYLQHLNKVVKMSSKSSQSLELSKKPYRQLENSFQLCKKRSNPEIVAKQSQKQTCWPFKLFLPKFLFSK